jgi:hypothetical protein
VGGTGALPTICSRDNTIRAILFFAGFLLIIILCTEEFARALAWLRTGLEGSPRRRFIVYPLLVLLMLAAGIIIIHSLIKFSATLPFSYD